MTGCIGLYIEKEPWRLTLTGLLYYIWNTNFERYSPTRFHSIEYRWLSTRLCRVCATLQWRHNEHNGVSNHRRLDWLCNRLFRHRSKEASKLRVTALCERNPPMTDGIPSQRTSNAENVPFNDVIMSVEIMLPWHLSHRYTVLIW